MPGVEEAPNAWDFLVLTDHYPINQFTFLLRILFVSICMSFVDGGKYIAGSSHCPRFELFTSVTSTAHDSIKAWVSSFIDSVQCLVCS